MPTLNMLDSRKSKTAVSNILNNLVLAKIEGYSTLWPAVAFDHMPFGLENPKPGFVFVYWLYDDRISKVCVGDVFPFMRDFMKYFCENPSHDCAELYRGAIYTAIELATCTIGESFTRKSWPFKRLGQWVQQTQLSDPVELSFDTLYARLGDDSATLEELHDRRAYCKKYPDGHPADLEGFLEQTKDDRASDSGESDEEPAVPSASKKKSAPKRKKRRR